MEFKSTEFLTPNQLSRLLELDREESWNQHDVAEAMRHQLAAPLVEDLESIPELATQMGHLKKLLASRELGRSETFLAHLTCQDSISAVLDAIKLFAKQVREEKDNPLRGGPATVLYYAAIAAALARCKARITNLSDSEIRGGCQWAIDQPGAEALEETFREAIQALS